MKMKRFEELFSRTLALALAAILILSGMLGMNAQAAENKITFTGSNTSVSEPTADSVTVLANVTNTPNDDLHGHTIGRSYTKVVTKAYVDKKTAMIWQGIPAR